MTSHHEVTLIQVSTRVLRGMLARCRAVFQSKVVVHNSSIYASQRGKQQVSHLWQTIFNSKRFFSKSRLIDPSKKVSDRERMGQGGSKEEDREMAQQFVDEKIKTNKVMVFSKSYCPFCKMAKEALNDTGVKYGLVELDERDDCSAIQDYLLKLTGARSVPRVFIGGKCIGGGSETRALQDQGKLVPMLKEIGAL